MLLLLLLLHNSRRTVCSIIDGDLCRGATDFLCHRIVTSMTRDHTSAEHEHTAHLQQHTKGCTVFFTTTQRERERFAQLVTSDFRVR
uniref:Putative secreted protein n=1 Tax=Anopheles marajoara TaxID=58244 RepID=A0A2M4CAI2_9DIPT